MIGVRAILLVLAAAGALSAAEPAPETTAAFDRYVQITEEGFAKQQGFQNFLWLDHHPKEKTMVWLQQSIVQPMKTLDQGIEIAVPGAHLEHWYGGVFLESRDSDADHLRGLLMNLAGYQDFFRQQIIESKLIKREGDNFDFLLRFHKKQFNTVVLNVQESGKYTLVDPTHWTFATHSTHIGEAEHPRDKKKLDEERDDAAPLWRLNFYWRVQQSDNGCYVELQVITLQPEGAGRLHPSRYLANFQNFGHDLTQYLVTRLEEMFPHHR